MNFTAIKKSSPIWQKISNDYDIITKSTVYKEHFTWAPVHKCFTEFLLSSKLI